MTMDDQRGARPPEESVRGPWRNALNTLFCVVAVAGLGLSAWAFVLQFIDIRDRAESRERITEACAGLIDPDPVLGLNGGGTDRAEPDDEHRADTGLRSSGCLVHRVGDPGTTYGHFSLALVVHPKDPGGDEREVEIDQEARRPFSRIPDRGDAGDATAVARHALPHPLGDGRLGDYDAYSVTARALCEDGGAVSSVEATAVVRYEPVTPQDRRSLAGLARQAADRAAGRTGCSARLPDVPSTLAEPKRTLGPVTTAGGTCAWYRRFAAEKRPGPLPDRALAAPAGKESAHDSCVLAVGEKTRGLYPDYADPEDIPEDLRDALRSAPWWVKTETFVGDGAKGLRSDDVTEEAELTPGTAGRASGGVWWASSVCEGRPAVHVMWLSYPYERMIPDQLHALFRAYVDDATGRRGCTGVVLPGTDGRSSPVAREGTVRPGG
ncbi:hypothetical protein ACYCCF_15830 [Streptomyces argenteolus]|uniref:hypothetical protein n=1 Tax=Streptomyces sp. NPDC025273 TaxID=3155251 RepID=UPI00340CDB19